MASPIKSAAISTRTVVCVYCRKPQEVGRGAMSIPCRFCQRSLNLEDVRIAGYAARRVIETCGAVTIEQKGDVTVNTIRCATLLISGRLKGNIISLGPVTIAATAILRGDIAAPILHIAEGARVQGHVSLASSG